MYLIDTNICIGFLKGNAAVVSQFRLKHQNCYIFTLVLAELYKGVYCSSKFQENIAALNQFANSLPKADCDQNAALEFGKIQAELRRIGVMNRRKVYSTDISHLQWAIIEPLTPAPLRICRTSKKLEITSH